jgi:hypothetical protein
MKEGAFEDMERVRVLFIYLYILRMTTKCGGSVSASKAMSDKFQWRTNHGAFF